MSSNMNRRPCLFSRIPPSPRTPSVTRIPRTLGGQIIPVGWNCTNSMSCSAAPARYARACPSPVYSQLLLLMLYARPMPPVASTTAFARKTLNRPRSRAYASAPATRSPGCRLDRRAQARTAGADDEHVVIDHLEVAHRIRQSCQTPSAHSRTYASVNPTQNRLAHAQFMWPRLRQLTQSYAFLRAGRPAM